MSKAKHAYIISRRDPEMHRQVKDIAAKALEFIHSNIDLLTSHDVRSELEAQYKIVPGRRAGQDFVAVHNKLAGNIEARGRAIATLVAAAERCANATIDPEVTKSTPEEIESPGSTATDEDRIAEVGLDPEQIKKLKQQYEGSNG